MVHASTLCRSILGTRAKHDVAAKHPVMSGGKESFHLDGEGCIFLAKRKRTEVPTYGRHEDEEKIRGYFALSLLKNRSRRKPQFSPGATVEDMANGLLFGMSIRPERLGGCGDPRTPLHV